MRRGFSTVPGGGGAGAGRGGGGGAAGAGGGGGAGGGAPRLVQTQEGKEERKTYWGTAL